MVWKTGGARVGTAEGVRRASMFRQMGVHRRWNADGLSEVRGVPWIWNPIAAIQPGNTDEEQQRGRPVIFEEDEDPSDSVASGGLPQPLVHLRTWVSSSSGRHAWSGALRQKPFSDG